MESTFWLGVHGLLMAIGWLVLVPTGIYKASVGRQQDPDNWLSTHQAYMSSAAAFIIPGAIIGVLACQTHLDKPHRIIGLIINIIFVVMVAGGLAIRRFLYDPHQPSRPVFNLLHKTFAPFLYYMAVINAAFGIHDYSKHFEGTLCRNILVGVFLLYSVFVIYWSYVVMPAWWKNYNLDRGDPIPSSA